MACLNGEQMARLALGLAEGEPLAAHVEQCEACRAKLAEMGRLTDQLTAAHAKLNRGHAAARSRLLASLAREEKPARRVRVWDSLTRRLGELTVRQRITVGGVGLSAAALVLLLLVFANSAAQLSAMERMIKAVREVTSYSFML